MKKEELKNNIKKLRDDPSHVHYFTTIVDELDLELGKNILEEVAIFTEKEGLKEAYGWAKHRLGWIYLDLMKFEMATNSHMMAYEIFLELDNIEGL